MATNLDLAGLQGDLNLLLKKKLTFPCCGEQAYVKDCIPGIIKCPNEACKSHLYRFSWCHLVLMDEVLNPRNHCSSCKTCKDAIDLHCQVIIFNSHILKHNSMNSL